LSITLFIKIEFTKLTYFIRIEFDQYQRNELF